MAEVFYAKSCCLPFTRWAFGVDSSSSLRVSELVLGVDRPRCRTGSWVTPPPKNGWGFPIHPWKINMEPENTPLEKEIIFQTIIFRFYVDLRGCSRNNFFSFSRRGCVNLFVSVLPCSRCFFFQICFFCFHPEPWGNDVI